MSLYMNQKQHYHLLLLRSIVVLLIVLLLQDDVIVSTSFGAVQVQALSTVNTVSLGSVRRTVIIREGTMQNVRSTTSISCSKSSRRTLFLRCCNAASTCSSNKNNLSFQQQPCRRPNTRTRNYHSTISNQQQQQQLQQQLLHRRWNQNNVYHRSNAFILGSQSSFDQYQNVFSTSTQEPYIDEDLDYSLSSSTTSTAAALTFSDDSNNILIATSVVSNNDTSAVALNVSPEQVVVIQQQQQQIKQPITPTPVPVKPNASKAVAASSTKSSSSKKAKASNTLSSSSSNAAAAYYSNDIYSSSEYNDDYDGNGDDNDSSYYYDDSMASSSSFSTTVEAPIIDPFDASCDNNNKPKRHLYEAERYPPTEVVKSVHDYSTMEEYFQNEKIRSRPVSSGNWIVEDPLRWTRDFGRRSPEYDNILQSIVKLHPGDEGYYDVSDMSVPGTTIVRTKEQAQIVMKHLMNADTNLIHACDTEVMDIDLKSVGPVGNGYCTCISVYSGPTFDYGLGQGLGTTLWIDNLDDACGIIQEFKLWFESEHYKKVWHNYGFDRHILWNEGIDLRGFWGDTMHMARLQDSSRAKTAGAGGYGLEALTADLIQDRKQPMKELFGVKRLRKDGSEGTLVDIPPVEVLQRNPKFRAHWIEYSARDAKSTWLLREKLTSLLKETIWIGPDTNMYDYYELHMRPFGEVLTDMERRGIHVDAKDYLATVEIQARQDRAHHVETFRQWAAKQIGANGLALNTASATQLCTFLFGGATNIKTNEATPTVREFKVPRDEIPEDALQAFQLEEEAANRKENELPEESKPSFDVEAALKKMKVAELKLLCKEKNLPVAGKKADLIARLIEQSMNVDESANVPVSNESQPPKDDLDEMSFEDLQDFAKTRGILHIGTKEEVLERLRQDIQMTKEMQEDEQPVGRDGCIALSKLLEMRAREAASNTVVAVPKYTTVKITSIGLQPEKFTVGGAPSVTADVIRKLAGDPFADPPKYGTAFDQVGKEGCEALFSLCAIGSIDTMIANFLTSLQELSDHQSRVHCSLNLNTETGRLSSRRPNLQNQPALEKDKYKIRKAFQASPGNNLIVADYGQLELRVLASMTKCKSMIDAFAAGGDFHSRTALDMFDYISKALANGEVLLEWDYSQGKPPKPLIKDMFASERRKAKTLNFSIAYGKTAHGLSQDWGVSINEAEEMLQKWYAARPEVKKWQDMSKAWARDKGTTRTIMGRYRSLPYGKDLSRKIFGQSQRASINTPIQGGAADIAMMAMNKINSNVKLKRLGWILLLQIHDEVILEGPEETSEEAFEEVIRCMEEPWVFGLPKTAVPLLVDGSHNHKTWYDAK